MACKEDIVSYVADRTGNTKRLSKKIVETILSLIEFHLSKGDSVKLTSIGTFSIREYKERRAHNISSNKTTLIEKKRKIHFKASSNLKRRVAENTKMPAQHSIAEGLSKNSDLLSYVRNKHSIKS